MSIHSKSLPSPETFGKVAVLMGGWSSERKISLKSGQAVLSALLQSGIDAHAVDVQRDTVIAALQNGGFDRAFNILHGPGGEDGVMQGVLDLLGIPYTGSNVMASALAMDKLRTKQVLIGAGLPTPQYAVLNDDTDFEYIVADLQLPLMVKPVLEGSSIGMSKVDTEETLLPAYEKAAIYEGDVIAEQYITGSEYTVAILGDEALPVIKLETPHTFYDFEAKYTSDDTNYICPCGLANEDEAQLQRLALSVFKAVGASGWGRVDLMCDQDGKPYVIEINTIPGMTDHSLVPMAAKAKGIDFNELVYRILMQTLSGSGSGRTNGEANVNAG